MLGERWPGSKEPIERQHNGGEEQRLEITPPREEERLYLTEFSLSLSLSESDVTGTVPVKALGTHLSRRLVLHSTFINKDNNSCLCEHKTGAFLQKIMLQCVDAPMKSKVPLVGK